MKSFKKTIYSIIRVIVNSYILSIAGILLAGIVSALFPAIGFALMTALVAYIIYGFIPVILMIVLSPFFKTAL